MMTTNGILNKMWTKSISQIRSNLIKVKCMVPTNIYIRDLNRTFLYNIEETVSAAEYHVSSELQTAIRKRLVVVVGSEQQSFKTTPTQNINIDKNMLKDVVSEVASELLQQILKGLPQMTLQDTPLQLQVEKKLQAVEIEEETFVKMQEKIDENINANLTQVEHKSVTTEKVLSSLAKMKNLKKEKGL